MASRVQNGMQGAQQGAQIGSNFGPYGAAAGAVIGGILGLTTPDYEMIALENYNKEVVKNNAMDIMDMRRQQNVTNIQYSQAIAAYQDELSNAKASYNAQFGAAEMIGASAQALQQTMAYQTDQAIAQLWFNFETEVDNMDTQLRRSTNAAQNSLKRAKGDQTKMDYAGMAQQGLNMYSQYRGQTTTQSSTGGGLSSFSDFGSFGNSGSASGSSSSGAMMG